MNIGKAELVAIARGLYAKPDFARCKESMRKRVITELWNDLKEKFPGRDFTCGHETRERNRLVQNLVSIFKCKFVCIVDLGLTEC